jgi:AraC-like DNA-binding protein
MTDMCGAKPQEAFAFDPCDTLDDEVVQATTAATRGCAWAKAERFDDFAVLCCGQSNLKLLSDPRSFSLTQRAGRIGPVAVAELIAGSEISIQRGQLCNSYRVFVPQSGHVVSVHQGSPVMAGPGTAAVLAPEGHTASEWAAGTRMIALRFDRCVVDDALSDAIGRQVTSQIDFAPVMPISSAVTQSWVNMLVLFTKQLLRPDNLLNRPLVGLPFVDSLVRGLLLATKHPHRDALSRDEKSVGPHAIRTAIEIIEQEAHLPLTLSSIAARSHASVRSLQQGFQHHLGTSPMSYLREVRLRRAHQTLLESDPSTVTVASVAHQWGFTNLGRFASAHAKRYGEPPSVTLRTAFGSARTDVRTLRSASNGVR